MQDFKGQKLSEGLSQWILLIFAVGGFFAGYLSGYACARRWKALTNYAQRPPLLAAPRFAGREGEGAPPAAAGREGEGAPPAAAGREGEGALPAAAGRPEA